MQARRPSVGSCATACLRMHCSLQASGFPLSVLLQLYSSAMPCQVARRNGTTAVIHKNHGICLATFFPPVRSAFCREDTAENHVGIRPTILSRSRAGVFPLFFSFSERRSLRPYQRPLSTVLCLRTVPQISRCSFSQEPKCRFRGWLMNDLVFG